jgi:hypothetical protein
MNCLWFQYNFMFNLQAEILKCIIGMCTKFNHNFHYSFAVGYGSLEFFFYPCFSQPQFFFNFTLKLISKNVLQSEFFAENIFQNFPLYTFKHDIFSFFLSQFLFYFNIFRFLMFVFIV